MGGQEKTKTGKHRGAGPGGPGGRVGPGAEMTPAAHGVRACSAVGVDMVILIIRPQTLLSGTRHALGIRKYDSAPRLPSVMVYSHLWGLYSRLGGRGLFGQCWLGILLV